MSFNPANFSVAGFVDVGGMSTADRKRLVQNDDGDGRVTERGDVPLLLAAAAYYDARPWSDFCRGKGDTCRDMADKLDRFGSYASTAQAGYAAKLIGWAQPKEAPAKAPASPVAASNATEAHYPLPSAPTARLQLPKLFDLMQRLSTLTIGKLKLSRKNQDTLVWIKIVGHDGVVGKIEAGFVSIFTARLDVGVHGISAADIKADLLRIEADPEAAAALHGKLSGRCSVCSRDLTDPESIERGIGPICLAKF